VEVFHRYGTAQGDPQYLKRKRAKFPFVEDYGRRQSGGVENHFIIVREPNPGSQLDEADESLMRERFRSLSAQEFNCVIKIE
jgi:hypothetical protein